MTREKEKVRTGIDAIMEDGMTTADEMTAEDGKFLDTMLLLIVLVTAISVVKVVVLFHHLLTSKKMHYCFNY